MNVFSCTPLPHHTLTLGLRVLQREQFVRHRCRRLHTRPVLAKDDTQHLPIEACNVQEDCALLSADALEALVDARIIAPVPLSPCDRGGKNDDDSVFILLQSALRRRKSRPAHPSPSVGFSASRLPKLEARGSGRRSGRLVGSRSSGRSRCSCAPVRRAVRSQGGSARFGVRPEVVRPFHRPANRLRRSIKRRAARFSCHGVSRGASSLRYRPLGRLQALRPALVTLIAEGSFVTGSPPPRPEDRGAPEWNMSSVVDTS